jgi:acetyl esterase/lipase
LQPTTRQPLPGLNGTIEPVLRVMAESQIAAPGTTPSARTHVRAEDIAWALRLAATYNVTAGITYFAAENFEAKLDVYQPAKTATPTPTLMFFHGGGWMEGSTKETWGLWFLPFLQLGWVVVNVDYRHSGVAPAPAAVEDCLRAVHWLTRNAAQYNVDARNFVLAGLSAGGHLALLTGMISPTLSGGAEQQLAMSRLDSNVVRESAQALRAAAIINWCGITDVPDMAQGRNQQEIALRWLGSRADRLDVAKSVSPLTYVRSGLPPIVTIHGDDDRYVPYSHATRLHDALSAVAVSNELITLPGSDHADLEAYMSAYPRIFSFLTRIGVRLQA